MLHGQQIPRHLLSEHPQPPTLHLNFSPHADLPVTTQSYCTRWVDSLSISHALVYSLSSHIHFPFTHLTDSYYSVFLSFHFFTLFFTRSLAHSFIC